MHYSNESSSVRSHNSSQGAQAGPLRVLAWAAWLTAIAATYVMRLADPDLWGHLRYGRFFFENRSLVVPDPFAFTSTGLAWQAHEYAAQILLWLAYDWGGAPGLIVLKCLVGGASLTLLLCAIRLGSTDARVWAPVAMLAASLLGRYFLFRPQLFTYLGLAFFTWTLLRYLRSSSVDSAQTYQVSGNLIGLLWTLPFALAIWANLHGGFVAGIGVVGLAAGLRTAQSYSHRGWHPMALWRDTRVMWGLLLACLAASLLTPHGWRTWPFLLTELGNPYNRRFIAEWQPLNLPASGWSGAVALLMMAGVVLAALVAQRRTRTVWDAPPWLWGVSTLPLAAMALSSNRHIPIFVLWAAPVLALLADTAYRGAERRRLRDGALLCATALAGLAAAFTITFAVADPAPRIRITESSLGQERPFGAAAFMRANGLRGNVYTPLWWGSYLTWTLYPNILVSSDGRNDTLFTVAQVGENLTFYRDDAADIESPWRYASDFLLVPGRAPVLPRLLADKRWRLIYRDAEAVLLARANGPWADLHTEQSQPPAIETFE